MIYFGIEDSRLLKYIGEYQNTYIGRNHITDTSEPITIPLKVLTSDGFQVTPDRNITVTDLNKGADGRLYKQFYNRGSGGIKFKITVLINENDTWYSTVYQKYKGVTETDHNLLAILRNIISTMTPVKVVTDAIDIPNQNYIITGSPSRKQTHEGYTEWELEFTTYLPITSVQYKNDNTRVKKAINSAKAKKVAPKKTASKKVAANQSALAKCKRSVLVYSKKKKVVPCVKTLQKILKQKSCYSGKIDGWFGLLTANAVVKYQAKMKFKKNIRTGKVNKTTYNSLCGKTTTKSKTTKK